MSPSTVCAAIVNRARGSGFAPYTLANTLSNGVSLVVTMTRVYAAGVVSMVVLMCAMGVAQGLVVPSARSASDPEPPFHFTTHAFEQRLDHFDMYNATTFSQRYLMNDTWFKPGGPIFFYTGNEGPIELFAQNTGFMWDIAPKFGALLLFGEHRYFGHRSVSQCVRAVAIAVVECSTCWHCQSNTDRELVVTLISAVCPLVTRRMRTPPPAATCGTCRPSRPWRTMLTCC